MDGQRVRGALHRDVARRQSEERRRRISFKSSSTAKKGNASAPPKGKPFAPSPPASRPERTPSSSIERFESGYGASQLLGITEGTLVAPPASPGRLIEFVGDSITAGYGNLGNEPHPDYGNPSPCTFSFDTESAYMSWGAVTARALLADASIVAASGWGVYRSRSGDMNEVLPKVYGNALGTSGAPLWDFRTKPQVVVINLGTNDFSPGDPGSAYTTALGNFVDTVRAKYPAAFIFCAVGTMYSTAQHAKALTYAQSVAAARGGDGGKVAVVDLGSQDALKGTGCDWHPSVAEDQRMADVLVPIVRQKLGW